MPDTDQEPQETEAAILPDPDDIEFPEIRNAGTRRLKPDATREMLSGVADRIEPAVFNDGVLSIQGGESAFAHLWVNDQGDGEALVRVQTTDPTIDISKEEEPNVLVPISRVGGGGFFVRSVGAAVRDTVEMLRG